MARAEEARAKFADAQPFRYVVIDDFFEADFCRELMAEFPTFDASRAKNEHGETGRKAVFTDLARLGAAYQRFDRLMRDTEFLGLISRITAIPKLLYDPEYVGGGTHQNLSGQELDPHVDFNFHPRRRWHRRLNLIVFLNAQWETSWGGCLELIRDPWAAPGANARERVVPLANRAVIFETTECSWHGFERIQLPPDGQVGSRRSIAVYFYSRERPVAETAVAHSTVYIPRPLSDRIRAGHTLGEPDLEEIRDLLARRDSQIKFLYEREQEFSTLIGGLVRSPSFRLGQMLTWPARAVRNLARSRSGGRARD
jgi:Rps23 Pro-64 3,4-dihydroxylase Tpa1-like proline 4-hydroxylase